MDTQDICLGVLTKNILKKFLDQGNISHKNTRSSMMLSIIISSLLLNTFKKKFPLDDLLIFNAV